MASKYKLGASLVLNEGNFFTNMKKAQESMGKFKTKLSDVFSNSSKSNKSFNNMSDSLGSVTKKALGAVAAFAGINSAMSFAGDVFQSGVEFESGMAKVGTIADTTQVSIKDLSSGVINLSDKMGVASGEISESLYQAISAGAKTSDALGLVEVATMSAKAGFTDTATAVDGLTSVLNTYGMATTEAYGLANQFLITQNKGKTTFGELAVSIGQVAPVANSVGVSTTELLSSVAALTANGLATHSAMTGLKAALSNVIKPTADASKTAATLGLDFSAAALKSKGFAGFMQDIKEKCQGNTDVMSKLFGSVEGLNAMLTLTSDNGMALMNSTMTEMGSNTTLLGDAYNQMQGTVSGQLNLLKTKFENFKVSLYESIGEENIKGIVSQLGTAMESSLPIVSGAVEGLAGVVTKAADGVKILADNWDKIGPVLAGVVGTVGTYVVVMGALRNVTNAVTVAQTLLNAARMGDPTMLIVAGIAALVGGFILLWNKCEGFRNFFIGMWEKIKAVWNTVKPYFTMIWENIKVVFNAGKENIAAAFNVAWTLIKAVWGNTGAYFKALWNTIKGIFSVVKNVLSGNWQGAWDAIKGIVGGWGTYFSTIWNNIAGVFSSVGNYFGTIFSNAVEIVKGVFGNVLTFFQEIWNKIKSMFTGIGLSIAEGISGAFKTVINSAIRFAGNLINKFIGSINGAIDFINNHIPGVSINRFQEVNLPMLANGGIIQRSGSVIVGERGPEILHLNRGAMVQPLPAGGGGNTNTFYITVYAEKGSDGIDEFVRKVKEKLDNM